MFIRPEIGLPGRILARLLPGKHRNRPSGRPKASKRADFGSFPVAVRPKSGPADFRPGSTIVQQHVESRIEHLHLDTLRVADVVPDLGLPVREPLGRHTRHCENPRFPSPEARFRPSVARF